MRVLVFLCLKVSRFILKDVLFLTTSLCTYESSVPVNTGTRESRGIDSLGSRNHELPRLGFALLQQESMPISLELDPSDSEHAREGHCRLL